MTRYRVEIELEADSIQDAYNRVLYPDGDPVEGVYSAWTMRLDDLPASTPRVRQCLSCDEPATDSGEGRWCSRCSDYEGTCVNDHCLTCGSST